MVKKIEAFKCEVTGSLHEDRERAVVCEFRAKMKRVGGTLPVMGSISSESIMEWLAGCLVGGVYPSAIGKLEEALAFWRNNTETRPTP